MEGRTAAIALAVLTIGLAACGGSEPVTTTVTTQKSSGSAPPSAPDRFTAADAREVVRNHYRLVNRGALDQAYSDFTADARSTLGPKAKFVAGYDATLFTKAHDLSTVPLGGDKYEISFLLSARAEDACGAKVDQEYSGSWIVADRSSGPALDRPTIQQLSGDDFVSAKADCGPGPVDPPPPEPTGDTNPDCAPGYSRCLDPNSIDYDCAGGTGDGPDYVSGPVYVTGPDPFGLDADYDGVACE